jgi:hypothetical protein
MAQPSIGMRLAEALTEDQIIHLLDTAFRMWGTDGMRQLISRVNQDVAATLAQLLDPVAPPKERIVSDDKLMEEWRELWEHWGDIVAELGDERGRYADQEHDWEAPYFAAESLSEDLDRVAEQMLSLLQNVHEIGEEDDGAFAGALLEIERGIKGFPEWMGADQNECGLGPATTRCLLEWERLVAGGSVAKLAQAIAMLEDRLENLYLSPDAVVEFFETLPEGGKREVYTHIDSHRQEPLWRERLKFSHSTWHRIYYAFRAAFDPEGYIDDCRELLHSHWHYGFPLIEYLVAGGKYAEADEVAGQTAVSLLKTDWQPEQSLLISVPNTSIHYGSPSEDVSRLLKDWLAIAEQLGRKERTAALRFQLVLYEHPHDWDRVAEGFHQFNRTPFRPTAARLLGQWQDYVVHAQVGWGTGIKKVSPECWPMWLLAAGMAEAPDGARFIAKTSEWLRSLLPMSKKQFEAQQALLALLTCDLMHFHEPAGKYRRLQEAICRAMSGDPPSTASRRAWLQKMQAGQLTALIMQCWTKHVAQLVPDPGETGGPGYSHNVRWLAALHELDPAAGQKLVKRWKELHKRRRNLWMAIQEHRLPL